MNRKAISISQYPADSIEALSVCRTPFGSTKLVPPFDQAASLSFEQIGDLPEGFELPCKIFFLKASRPKTCSN